MEKSYIRGLIKKPVEGADNWNPMKSMEAIAMADLLSGGASQ